MQRYEQFRGDEMHFFSGVVEGFIEVPIEEDTWKGKKLMPIAEVVRLLTDAQPFPEELAPYYSAQLEFLKNLE